MADIDPILTPAYLTGVLKRSGALEGGEVIAVSQGGPTPNRGVISEVFRLSLAYSREASGERPGSLFVKSSRTDLHPEFAGLGRREIELYQFAASLGGLPIPRCFQATFDPDSGRVLLITDDLAETHFQRPLPLPPSKAHCESLIDALADLHARFWGDVRLGTQFGERMTLERAVRQAERLHATLPEFLSFLGDSLLPAQRATYERILASHYLQQEYARLINLDRVTLIHGDVHSANVMLPLDEHGQVKLIDWQLWDIGVCTQDLAFLMALHWSPRRRMLLEQPLLRRYHTRLVENGVQDYSWADCFDDYRRAVITTVLIPIGQFRRGMSNGVVWFGMEDATAAFDDLACEELLS